jgi:CBS domain-containing protein
MVRDVVTCSPTDDLESLARTMTERRVRHIPVVEDGAMVAIVSIGDVVKHRLDELQAERDQLASYVHG